MAKEFPEMDHHNLTQVAQGLLQAKTNASSVASMLEAFVPLADEKTAERLMTLVHTQKEIEAAVKNLYNSIAKEATSA